MAFLPAFPVTLGTDLTAMLTDPLFGSTVVFGAVTTVGILSREERMQDDGSGLAVPVRVTVLLVRDSALPNCITDSALTIDGASYVVRSRGRVDDGGAREYHVAEVVA